MIYRALVQKNTTSTTDGLGLPAAPTWVQHFRALACWAWSDELDVESPDKVAAEEILRMIVPRGTDISEKHRISSISDRRGTTLFSGPWEIRVAPTGKLSHIELELRRVK